MKKIIVLSATFLILFCGFTLAWGQPIVSEEAKRHVVDGATAFEAGNYALAIEEFELAKKLAPDWPEVYYNLGMAQKEANRYNAAVKNLRKYLALAPEADDAEKVQGAINDMEITLEQKNITAEAQLHFDRGMTYLEEVQSHDDYLEAIKEFKRARKLAPDWTDVYLNLGIVQANAGQFSAAKKTLKKLRQLTLGSPDVFELNKHISAAEVEARRLRKEIKETADEHFHRGYDPALIHSFLNLCYEFSGCQEMVDKDNLLSQKIPLPGFSLGWFMAGMGDIQPELRFGYRRLKADQIGFGLENIPDYNVYGGFRFYPNKPTFGLGKIPIRLSLSALAGMHWLSPGAWNDAFSFSALMSGALSISSSDSRYGLMFEFVFQPLTREIKMKQIDNSVYGTLVFKPAWYLRIALMFSPLPF